MGAAGAVMVFFLVHMVTFRLSRPENILRTVMHTVAAVMGLQVAAMTALVFVAVEASVVSGLCSIMLSVLLYGLAAFFYILWIFGPYETSVRYRVLRELGLAPTGLTLNELLERYNGRMILDTRLHRLVAAGDVYHEGNVMRVTRKVNMFFLLDTAAARLRRLITAREGGDGA